MKVGTLVQIWHDTGAMGHVPVYGVIIREMPRTFLVLWERNRQTRVRKMRPNGVEPVKPYNVDTAREVLESNGVELPQASRKR